MKREIRIKTRDGYLPPELAARYREVREQIEREKPEFNERVRRNLEERKTQSNDHRLAREVAEKQAAVDHPGCDEFSSQIVGEEQG